MNIIFALCGKPGSGKTTITHKIMKYYKCVSFSADEIMLELFGEIPDRVEFKHKLELCKKIIYKISLSILQHSNVNIILDFGFWTKEERRYLEKIFIDYTVVFIYMKVEENELWKRIQYRNEHLKEGEYLFDKETFEYLASEFEDLEETEEYTEYNDMKKLRGYIKNINRKRKGREKD
jgi:predicted kinase